MANKIGKIWKEYIVGLSIVMLVVGLIVLIFGILGMWFDGALISTFAMDQDILSWSLYILIIGIILTLAGVFYLYDFITNKRFLLEEIQTNKRSEFMKNHVELKNAARHLPSKYQEMLSKKEKELRIK